MQPNIIPLESIQIATPCRADWNAMQKVQGADCIRFCQGCGKNVYDVSGITRTEATNLIAVKEGNLCLRLHRRQDGTIITSDCPVGKATAHKRKYATQMLAAVTGVGAALLSSACLLVARLSAAPKTKPTTNAVLVHKPQSAQPTPWPEVSRPVIDEHVLPNSPPLELPPPPSGDSQVTVVMGAPPPPAEWVGISPPTT